MISFQNIKPILTKNLKGKEIKRYDVTIVKRGNTSNVNIGVTPSGTVYYRQTTPNKSWSSLYMQKYDGRELFVDTFKSNEYTKAVVEERKDMKVTNGKIVARYNEKGAKNQISEYTNVGKHSNNNVSKDITDMLTQLKNNVDMTGLKPRTNKIKKIMNRFFVNKK